MNIKKEKTKKLNSLLTKIMGKRRGEITRAMRRKNKKAGIFKDMIKTAAQPFSKFIPRKKGGTLYGTKHQRGRKKKNKGKKQRGGIIAGLLGYGTDGNAIMRLEKDMFKGVDSMYKVMRSAHSTAKRG